MPSRARAVARPIFEPPPAMIATLPVEPMASESLDLR
ncbi:hypothetical protein BH23PLA1_BH23PLA1_27770 [soil metagenome]